MIDQNARNRLIQNQSNKVLVDGLNKVASSIQANSTEDNDDTSVATLLFLDDLNEKITNLVTQISAKNSSSDKASQMTIQEFNKIRESVGQIEPKLQEVFDQIKSKLENIPSLIIPKSVELQGKVEVSNFPVPVNFPEFPKINIPAFPDSIDVKSLPPVVVSNLKELSTSISNLQATTLQAIQALKVKFPDSFKITDEVKVNSFGDLLDGIEELKKGFNILIKTTQESKGLDRSKPMAVEIVADLPRPTTNPVTNISINGLGGFAKSTQVTVTSGLTVLPPEVLTNRRSVIIYNNSNQTVEIGGSTFTFGNGLPVPSQSYSPTLDAGSEMILYGRVASSTADVRVLELSDIATGR